MKVGAQRLQWKEDQTWDGFCPAGQKSRQCVSEDFVNMTSLRTRKKVCASQNSVSKARRLRNKAGIEARGRSPV